MQKAKYSIEDIDNDSVRKVFSEGFMMGTTVFEFEPELLVTRGMVCEVLYRIYGTKKDYECLYLDVFDNDWFKNSSAWCYENGFFKDVIFNGNLYITKKELSEMIKCFSGTDIICGQQINRGELAEIICRLISKTTKTQNLLK